MYPDGKTELAPELINGVKDNIIDGPALWEMNWIIWLSMPADKMTERVASENKYSRRPGGVLITKYKNAMAKR